MHTFSLLTLDGHRSGVNHTCLPTTGAGTWTMAIP